MVTDITIKANYFSVILYRKNLIGFQTVNSDPRKYQFLMSCIVMIYKELFLTIPKFLDPSLSLNVFSCCLTIIRGLLEKYPTFGREKETGLPGALDT